MYIENYSIRMDLQIVLMTVKTMFLPGTSNAETRSLIVPQDISEDKKEGKK